jgi:hypothetical protein
MVGFNEVIEQNKYLNFKKNNFRVLADKTIKLIWFQYLSNFNTTITIF